MNATSHPALPADVASQLADFARACKGAARAVSLYPAAHPAIATSLARLVETAGALTAAGPVQVRVRQRVLLIGDAAPARPDQAITELADLLSRHLIGAMTVNAGADASSWRALLLLLARTPEDVRADGGIAHLWAAAAGPGFEIREIDYAEVLRERHGEGATLDEIIAAALDGAVLDDDRLDDLLAKLGDPSQLDDLMARLADAAGSRGSGTRTAAVVGLLRALAARARALDPAQLETTLEQLGSMAARLTPEEMLELLAQRDPESGADAVGSVVARMRDEDVAQFVAGAVMAEGGASARLAHAFQALVPDTDRQRRLLALAHDRVAESPLGADASAEELWGSVETMVTDYSDESFVSGAYARELWSAQTRAVDVERTADDPPERVAAWVATVNDASLRGLDHRLLQDLLEIEDDLARWRDIAETTAQHAEDLVRVGGFDQAWALADAILRQAEAPERAAAVPLVLQRFARSSFLKPVAAYLRTADDEAFAMFERLCRAIGTPVIAPLAEALSAEQDARARRRLRDVLVAFGAQGRDGVQPLMHASNWEVRRTAAFLLREFGGEEGLRELMPLLTDHEPLVQREAVHGLMLNGSDAAGAILVQALDTATGRARQTLLTELTSMRDERAAPLFGYLVRHLDRARHPQLYLAAIEALGTLGGPAAVDALAAALERGSWRAPLQTRRIRAAAAAALRRLGSSQALGALKQAAGGRGGARAAARAELSDRR